MKTITLVRHAESVANAGGITLPHAAIPLSSLGHRQAALLADALDVVPSAIFASQFLRAQETAAPFCLRHNLTANLHPSLHEFSIIDPALIDGLDGPQRKPFVTQYWANPDPHRRLGPAADTFVEFESRVREFLAGTDALPDKAVIFGHGIWFGLLHWLLLGYQANDAAGMREFRRFQQALPMPNCAVFSLSQTGHDRWSVRADAALATRISMLAN